MKINVFTIKVDHEEVESEKNAVKFCIFRPSERSSKSTNEDVQDRIGTN